MKSLDFFDNGQLFLIGDKKPIDVSRPERGLFWRMHFVFRS